MDLSKAFECIPYDLLIAKLNAHGFDRKSLVFFYSYLKRRKQCVNLNNIQSTFQTLLSWVSQGLILELCYLTYLKMILSVFYKSLHYTILQMITQ